MVSMGRINRLRLEDVRRRIWSQLTRCDDVLYGRHRYFRFLGELAWLRDHPDGCSADQSWRAQIRCLAWDPRDDLTKTMLLHEAFEALYALRTVASRLDMHGDRSFWVAYERLNRAICGIEEVVRRDEH